MVKRGMKLMFKNFDVIAKRKLWFSVSGLLVLLSIMSIIMFRFNWGIDFTGGTILELGFQQNVTVEQVRNGIREDGLETAVIQLSGSIDGESGNDVIIRTRNLSANESQTIIDHINTKVGTAEVKRIETVGAVIGSEVTKNTLLNVLLSFGAMILYMTIRFEHRIAFAAIVAIVHDILMVLGVFAFFHLEVDASFYRTRGVEGVQGLVGRDEVPARAMNESVVIFDRIREAIHTHRRTDSFAILANDSIHQTIRRSMYTLITTLFCVTSLYLFGGDTTKNFALVMLVGFISGAYSSVCVATSIWVTWHEHVRSSRNRAEA